MHGAPLHDRVARPQRHRGPIVRAQRDYALGDGDIIEGDGAMHRALVFRGQIVGAEDGATGCRGGRVGLDLGWVLVDRGGELVG